MPDSLSQYALRFLQSEAEVRARLDCAVLLWEDSIPESANRFMPTMSGLAMDRPEHGEAVVFELRKALNKVNPFTMGVTVGRTPQNDVVLADNSISRFHAYFQLDPKSSKWKLVDAESRNGTWVGDLKLAANAPVLLEDQQRLRFGDVKLQLLAPESFLTLLRHKARAS